MESNELSRRKNIIEGFDLDGKIDDVKDFFSDEFIDYVLSKKWYDIRTDFFEKFGIYELIKKPFGDYEIRLFNALIHMELDISKVVEEMNEEQKEQISKLGLKLLDEGKIKPSKLSKIMDRATLTNYVEENEEKFSSKNIISFIENRKIERIPNSIFEGLIENESYEECKKIAIDYALDKTFLERKISYDIEQTAIREKNRQRNTNMRSIEEKEIQNLTEGERKTLIEDTTAVQFYKMAKKYNFSQELISLRQEFDKKIIDNSANYSQDTVLEAFSGLYYKNSVNNVLLDLKTLLNYGENETKFREKIKDFDLIKDIYEFLSGNIDYDNASDFQDKINFFKEKCESFNYETLKELQNISTEIFNRNLSQELEDTRDKITSNIEPEIIEGTNVKLYRIENQSEKQRDFTILIHSESLDGSRNYYGVNRHKDRMSFSVLDDNHSKTYITEIKFGYFGLKDEKIYSVNTCDGQTGQNIMEKDIEYAKKMQNELYSIKDFMNHTKEDSYNEITIIDNEGNNIRPKPDYLLIDHTNPNGAELEIAQKYNLPIYFINYDKYIDKNKTSNNLECKNTPGIYNYDCFRDIVETEKSYSLRDDIQNIIDRVDRSWSKKDIVKFVHIELGKALIYDNSYSDNKQDKDDKESDMTQMSKERRERLLHGETKLDIDEQVCKGMAEISAAIFNSLGIDAKVIGVEQEGDIDGEAREDSDEIIIVPEIYSVAFDGDKIVVGDNEQTKETSTKAQHYYTQINIDGEEPIIQDYLIKETLARIKMGETTIDDEIISGLCTKENFRERVEKAIPMQEDFKRKVESKLYSEYGAKPTIEDKLEFIFDMLQQENSKLGYEEANKYFWFLQENIINDEDMKQVKNRQIITFIKETEENAEIVRVYNINGHNYCVRGNLDDLKNLPPIGEISEEQIYEIMDAGYEIRGYKDKESLLEITSKKEKSLLESAEEAIEEGSRMGKVNEETQKIKGRQQERINPDIPKENNGVSLDD